MKSKRRYTAVAHIIYKRLILYNMNMACVSMIIIVCMSLYTSQKSNWSLFVALHLFGSVHSVHFLCLIVMIIIIASIGSHRQRNGISLSYLPSEFCVYFCLQNYCFCYRTFLGGRVCVSVSLRFCLSHIFNFNRAETEAESASHGNSHRAMLHFHSFHSHWQICRYSFTLSMNIGTKQTHTHMCDYWFGTFKFQ